MVRSYLLYATVTTLCFDFSAGALSCELTCPTSGKCVIGRRVCDGRVDCPDDDGIDEDEENCLQWECHDGWVKCADGKQCVDKRKICDGHKV